MIHKPLTWGELADYIGQLDPSFLDCHVSISFDGEFFSAIILESLDDDILDNGHPYLEVLQWQ